MYKFQLYSKSCEYVIRTLEYMTSDRRTKRFLTRDICRKLKIPEFYTRKGLQVLSRLGILKSLAGPGGGYQLSKKAKQLSVLDIIRAVDGKRSFEHCVMGLPRCSGKKPCAIHHLWSVSKKNLLCDLAKVKLDQLNSKSQRQRILLKTSA